MLAVSRLDILIASAAVFTLASSNNIKVTSVVESYELCRNGTVNWNDDFVCSRRTDDLGSLLRNEKIWTENIKSYRSGILFYLNILKRDNEFFKEITSEILDKTEYLGTPTSLFFLLKRVTSVWPKAVRIMRSLPGIFNLFGNNSPFSAVYYELMNKLPSISDLHTGYRGLSRLNRVYNVPTTSVADLGTTSSGDTAFSARDSLEAAKYFCTRIPFLQCQEWIEKTIEKINQTPHHDIPIEEFLELYYVSHCINGNVYASRLMYQALIEIDPSYKPLLGAHHMIIRYGCEGANTIIEEEEEIVKYYSKNPHTVKGGPNNRFILWDIVDEDQPSILELCNHRALYVPTARLLKCRYVHYNKPYLRIGPFKVEEFHIDPPILMFHDVISDREADEWVKFGRPRMQRATLSQKDGTDKVTLEFRTNAHRWVKDHELPLAPLLGRRATLMTGWNPALSERNQIACYGPAAEFTPHIDSVLEDDLTIDLTFADFSTVMFYINDVTAGGYTVFPALNVTLVPRKGSAAVWINRRPDGFPDRAMMHGGCPVIKGYKWVINTWFQRFGQDFPKCKDNNETSFRYFYL